MSPLPVWFPDRSQPVARTGHFIAFLSVALLLLPLRRLMAEDRTEYRYEEYREEAGRMQVQTHSTWFEYDLHQKVTARGSFVQDALSGATPTGAPEQPNGFLETQYMEDTRRSGSVEAAIRLGRTTTTPQIAYSEESDYRSLGLSLTESIDFNQRNTTLTFGANRNIDAVSRSGWNYELYKGSSDFMVGLTQILGPRSVLTVNLTLGYADGYLTDPYKGVNASIDLPWDLDARPDVTNSREARPRHRFKQVAYVGFTQGFAAVNGAMDASHRFHRDDWGVIANTFQLVWNQRLGKRVILSPLFRYHHQTEADFYLTRLETDPAFAGSRVAFDRNTNDLVAQEGFDDFFEEALKDPATYAIFSLPDFPAYYSADYRLSRMQTFTYGLSVTVEVHERVSLSFAYKYYDMDGLDGRTSQRMYPAAHIFTAGFSARF